jgi:hypothetical protein
MLCLFEDDIFYHEAVMKTLWKVLLADWVAFYEKYLSTECGFSVPIWFLVLNAYYDAL